MIIIYILTSEINYLISYEQALLVIYACPGRINRNETSIILILKSLNFIPFIFLAAIVHCLKTSENIPLRQSIILNLI